MAVSKLIDVYNTHPSDYPNFFRSILKRSLLPEKGKNALYVLQEISTGENVLAGAKIETMYFLVLTFQSPLQVVMMHVEIDVKEEKGMHIIIETPGEDNEIDSGIRIKLMGRDSAVLEYFKRGIS